MEAPLPKETLAELCLRHINLIVSPYIPITPELTQINLLNKLASVQVDLLKLSSSIPQAKLLFERLQALPKDVISTDELKTSLLALLHTAQ